MYATEIDVSQYYQSESSSILYQFVFLFLPCKLLPTVAPAGFFGLALTRLSEKIIWYWQLDGKDKVRVTILIWFPVWG